MAENNSSSGIGFVGLLTIAFIVLKLTGVIAWSWWWVISPVWISTGLFIVVAVAGFSIYGTVQRVKAYRAKKRRAKFSRVA